MGLLSKLKGPKAPAPTKAEETSPSPPSDTITTIDAPPSPAEDDNEIAPVTLSAPIDESTIVYPTGFKLGIILFAICCAVFLVALDQTILSTAIPKITDDFASIRDIGWYGSAYLLTSTAFQPVYGRIYSIFSIKIAYMCAIGMFELGSLICGVANSSVMLIIGRAIAGLGGGGIFSGSVVTFAYCLPLAKRPAAFGLVGSMWGIASVAGPLLGGAFTDHATWRWCFFINLPIGAISLTIVLFVLHIPRKNNPLNLSFLARIRQLDIIGASLLIYAIICLLLALQWGGQTYPWSDSRIIGLFIGFGGLLACFIALQIRLGNRGTFPPRLFANRNIIGALAFAFFFGSGFFALVFYIAIYFQSVLGSSATQAGIQMLPLLIAVVISSIGTGGLITWIGIYTPVYITCMVLFAIGAGLLTTLDIDSPMGAWFGYQVLAGLGVGCGFQAGSLIVQTILPLADVPTGTTAISFSQQLGGALFVSIAQTVFQNGLVQGLHKYTPELPSDIFLHAGATSVRPILASLGRMDLLEGVLRAYVLGLRYCFFISMGCACAAFGIACSFEWRSVKKGHGQGRGRRGFRRGEKDVEEMAGGEVAPTAGAGAAVMTGAEIGTAKSVAASSETPAVAQEKPLLAEQAVPAETEKPAVSVEDNGAAAAHSKEVAP